MGLPKGYIASLSSTAISGASAGGATAGDTEGVVGMMAGATASENSKPVLNPSGENKKWDEIQKHIASMNSSDWRMAILEADILLYDKQIHQHVKIKNRVCSTLNWICG